MATTVTTTGYGRGTTVNGVTYYGKSVVPGTGGMTSNELNRELVKESTSSGKIPSGSGGRVIFTITKQDVPAPTPSKQQVSPAPPTQVTDRLGQPVSSPTPGQKLIMQGGTIGGTPNPQTIKASQIDWRTTFEGGSTQPGKVTAQTYANYKIGQGLNYVTDKVASVVPFENWVTEKKYSFDYTAIPKFAAFEPLVVSGQTSLIRSLKAGDIIPESQTTFTANIKQVNPELVQSNVVSKTETLGQTSTGISQSFFKLSGENEALGLTKSYIFRTTPKGTEVRQIGSVSKQTAINDVYLTGANKDMVATIKLDDISGIASRSASKENAAFLNTRSYFEPGTRINVPIKINKNIIDTKSFGLFKPLNQDRSLFSYVGTNQASGRLGGVGIDFVDFNVKGFVLKVGEESSFDLGMASRGLNLVERKAISSQVTSLSQSSTNSIIGSLPRTSFKPTQLFTAPQTLSMKPSQSLYYGTGQYERTQGFSYNTNLLTTSKSDNLFFNVGRSSASLPSTSLTTGQYNILATTQLITPTQPVDFKQFTPQTPINIQTDITTTSQRQRIGDPFIPIGNTPLFDFTPPNGSPFFIPTLDLDLSGSLSPRRTGRQKKKRTPSLYAALFDIRASSASASEITGISLRPILTNRRRKR